MSMYEGQWSLAIYVYVCVSLRALSHYVTGYAPGVGPIEQVTMVCLQGGSFVYRVSNRHYSYYVYRCCAAGPVMLILVDT
jgi:hypothetical protein